MKIDEAGFQAAREHAERIDWLPDDGTEADRQDGYRQLREILSAYLDALPSAEPGRDRIAVVVNAYGGGTADVMPTDPSLFDWEQLEAAAGEFEIEGPFAHNVVACRLRYYEPDEPVEVEGSVEGVG